MGVGWWVVAQSQLSAGIELKKKRLHKINNYHRHIYHFVLCSWELGGSGREQECEMSASEMVNGMTGTD